MFYWKTQYYQKVIGLQVKYPFIENAEKVVKEAAQECRQKLDDAISKLEEFIREISFAIDYEEKQNFLLDVSFFDFRIDLF